MKLNLLSILAIVALADSQDALQCRDESGKAVDWYVVYKFPYIAAKNDRSIFSGYNYAYQTSNTTEDGWHLSDNQITDPKKSIFAQTLNPILAAGQKKFGTAFYSDQPPTEDDPSASYAHAKGVVAADSKQGFWLIHTVPQFVPANKTYVYPASGGRYGQVALCISLPVSELTKVVDSFRVAHVFTYSHTTSTADSLKTAIENLASSKWIKSNNFTDQSIQSLGGVQFRSFYKSPDDHVDLYASIVAPGLKSSLFVETWRREPGTPLNSECSLKQKVENIEEVKVSFNNNEHSGTFDYMNDHSKWAVSEDSNVGAVCLGDMNRMKSQWKRGGGSTCLTRPQTWKAFHNMVAKFEKCSS